MFQWCGATAPNDIFVLLTSLSLKIFKLIRLGQAWFLPPGFCIRGTLEFTPVTEEKVKDSIQIIIDDEELLEVPVTGYEVL